MDNVVVVTVTYNSSKYLERLVKSLRLQTVNIGRVIIVDNASDSQNAELNTNIAEKNPFVDLIRLGENLGGAGGFEVGMRYVIERNISADWIWIMDDDAFPLANCLENLLKYQNLENIGCLVPLIYGVDLQAYQLNHFKKESKYLDRDIRALTDIEEAPEYSKLDATAFVGPLIRMDVVRELGFPDGSLFIYGDDLEYTYRISRRHNVYLIKSAVINHRDVVASPSIQKSIVWKSYYKYRNRFLFIKEFQFSKRDKLIGELLLIKSIIWEIGSIVKDPKHRGFRQIRIKYLFKAIIDGLQGRRGKTVDPSLFK